MLIQSIGNSVKNGLLWINVHLIYILYYISYANQKSFSTDNWLAWGCCDTAHRLYYTATSTPTKRAHLIWVTAEHNANICITHSQNKCWSTFIIGTFGTALQKWFYFQSGSDRITSYKVNELKANLFTVQFTDTKRAARAFSGLSHPLSETLLPSSGVRDLSLFLAGMAMIKRWAHFDYSYRSFCLFCSAKPWLKPTKPTCARVGPYGEYLVMLRINC